MEPLHVEDGDVVGLTRALARAAGEKSCVIQLARGGNYVVSKSEHGTSAFPLIPRGCEVIIRGNGATLSRSGPSLFRFFTVQGRLQISQLTLCNGRVKGTFGGCIAVSSNAQLVLENCHVSNCESVGHAGQSGGENGGGGGGGGQGACGGAIYSEGGHVCIYKCTFDRNRAIGGSGGNANPHRGRYVGQGGNGGGRAGGQGGAVGCAGLNASEERADSFEGCFGGGGGGSSGANGSNGGKGAWGGGGGGAGAKTLGGFDGTGEPGKGGWGGGSGGIPGASSGSAGGGGGAFGGAICAINGGSLILRDSVIQRNECMGGQGGRHPWGWPAGHVGQSFGGGVFVWNLEPLAVEVGGVDTLSVAFNVASVDPNVYDSNRASEVHLAPLLISKKRSIVDTFSQLTVRCSLDSTPHCLEPIEEESRARRGHARSLSSPASFLSLPSDSASEGGESLSPRNRMDSTCSQTNSSKRQPQDDNFTGVTMKEEDECRTRVISLPVHLVQNILEYYVGWDLSESDALPLST